MGREASARRQQERDETLQAWASGRGVELTALDDGQQWVVFGALHVMAWLGSVVPLRRVAEALLAHCGMGLSSTVIAAITATSPRAIRDTQHLTPKELLKYVQKPVVGHRKPKLEAEHAGLLAKYLVSHPRARAPEIIAYLQEQIGVSMDRLTLRRYIGKYGLGCLRGDQVDGRPLFSEPPSTVEPSC